LEKFKQALKHFNRFMSLAKGNKTILSNGGPWWVLLIVPLEREIWIVLLSF